MTTTVLTTVSTTVTTTILPTAWQQTAGPEGGDIPSLAIDPSNGQVVYAGTGSSGIFKTTNGGNSWTAINTGLTISYVSSIAIAPSNSRIIYAGTDGGGVFKTED